MRHFGRTSSWHHYASALRREATHQRLGGAGLGRNYFTCTQSLRKYTIPQRSVYSMLQRRNFVTSCALVRDIPDSFVNALSTHAQSKDPVNLALAKQQHADYVALVTKILLEEKSNSESHSNTAIIRLPAMEDHPDCCFVEDTAIIVEDPSSSNGGKLAVILSPGHASRQAETHSVQLALEKYAAQSSANLKVVTLSSDATSTLSIDGGDVLVMADAIWVGLSQRTNIEAINALREILSPATVYAVPAVVQGSTVLHLKSVTTALNGNTLLLPNGRIGEALLDAMGHATAEANTDKEHLYDIVRLDDIDMCNVVTINKHVLAQDKDCKSSRNTLQRAAEQRGLQVHWVDTSEIAKKDGALTCCSLLI